MQRSLNGDTSETRSIHVQKFITLLEERTESYHSNTILRTATFCDPRFKDSYFTNSHKDHILRILRSDSQNIVSDDFADQSIPEIVEKPTSLFNQFLMDNCPIEEAPKKHDSLQEELDEYLRTPPISTSDPYDYWRSKTDLPELKKLAHKYLSIPSTSSESERLFSLSGLVCTPKRSSLKPETLDQLTFCSANLKIFGDI
ncbi:hypothetical protein GCK72_025113 [Caenorhabditis remanei]|uniref:HAT C-terminal dimerisation domain-containing protein n=1 Tax=Caenorhabditis remanei TaxID=31234 RepID=A0A6A5G124_CAERE|nr:hypothetical protein GCK72_025113 [Caenorhabditis remanei]KAF1748646.1 hypothetical protein GCK72_025113 [Caenorhabditis remanei]